MKSFLSTLVSIFISISVHAQITGTVLGENLHPLGYANVAMYSLPDSAFLTGTIKNELGKYVFAKADNASSIYLKSTCKSHRRQERNEVVSQRHQTYNSRI